MKRDLMLARLFAAEARLLQRGLLASPVPEASPTRRGSVSGAASIAQVASVPHSRTSTYAGGEDGLPPACAIDTV